MRCELLPIKEVVTFVKCLYLNRLGQSLNGRKVPESARRRDEPPTFSSTPTTPSIGTLGAAKHVSWPTARTIRSSCQQATRPAIGGISWNRKASRTWGALP